LQVRILLGSPTLSLAVRALRDVDLARFKIQNYKKPFICASHKIGKLKSKAAYRSLRLSSLVPALREWELLGPKGDLGLVFPNSIGKVESYANLIDRGFAPIQIAAGVMVQKEALDASGAAVTGTPRPQIRIARPAPRLRVLVDRARP
jgi:hypothetical protein